MQEGKQEDEMKTLFFPELLQKPILPPAEKKEYSPTTTSPIQTLNELCVKRNWPNFTFEFYSVLHDKTFYWTCSVSSPTKEWEDCTSVATSKKEAQRQSALKILTRIKQPAKHCNDGANQPTTEFFSNPVQIKSVKVDGCEGFNWEFGGRGPYYIVVKMERSNINKQVVLVSVAEGWGENLLSFSCVNCFFTYLKKLTETFGSLPLIVTHEGSFENKVIDEHFLSFRYKSSHLPVFLEIRDVFSKGACDAKPSLQFLCETTVLHKLTPSPTLQQNLNQGIIGPMERLYSARKVEAVNRIYKLKDPCFGSQK